MHVEFHSNVPDMSRWAGVAYNGTHSLMPQTQFVYVQHVGVLGYGIALMTVFILFKSKWNDLLPQNLNHNDRWHVGYYAELKALDM